MKKFNELPTTGNANGVTAGNAVDGAALPMGRVHPGTLSAQITVDAETTSLTFSLAWQGSVDEAFTTPINIGLNELNGAAIVLATGTAGADAAVTKAVPAPMACYGFRFVRARLVVSGATGTTNDTYSIGYNYDRR